MQQEPGSEIDQEQLEFSRKLFAGSCQFFAGSTKLKTFRKLVYQKLPLLGDLMSENLA